MKMRYPIYTFVFPLLIVFVFNASSFAQEDQVDQVDEFSNYSILSPMAAKVKELNEEMFEYIKANYAKSHRRDMMAEFEDYHTYTDDMFIEGSFVKHDLFDDYLDRIVSEILTKNNIKKEIVVVLDKSPSLNAYCLPNGLLVVNMGLFFYLENEDQLASIIAHEISHNLLQHGLNTVSDRVLKYRSKEYKEEVKRLRSARYNQSGLAMDLIREDLYSSGRIRRQHEIQADSLGYALMKSTDYEPREFLAAMESTVLYDTLKPKGLLLETYETYFNLEEVPFDTMWFKDGDTYNYTYHKAQEEFVEDSISTHPEMSDRLDELIKQFSIDTVSYVAKRADSSFYQLQKIAQLHQMEAFEWMEEYGVGLYIALYRLQQYPDDQYYLDWMSRFLNYLKDARSDYKLNRYVEQPNEDGQSPSYQNFLRFIWNLDYQDLVAFDEHYSKTEE